MRVSRAILLSAALVGLLPVLSCTNDGGAGVLAPAGQGRATILMHDHDMTGLAEAHVTISSVRAHQVGGGWVPLAGTFPMEVDLLSLVNGRTVTLASGALPAGDYDALEITITAVRLVTRDGTVITLELPPGGRTVVIEVFFTVLEGQETVLTLDFRVDLSFEFRGNEIEFHPEIEVEGVEHHG
jgi:hypothetical protein